ncbi:hypothetical protein C5B85_00205 [Pseudoclavibacter sp. AY1F1]|uniref:hypothetical protein n=1 Tax=Pseudoclavibacter sp. AY1F1 TaxID=2080583 RepID=UPI000CE86F5C|nr:hypothetical protein [Pseudoclavibacter sp. AY1F1]PPF46755.1 hypothetical protein C5B85_00205 [Pseudoclavibacter sp. AY1F1]
MDQLHYAGGVYFTSTKIARELVGYAAALAEVHQASVVEIPVRHSDGTANVLSVLVGPSSQIATETVDTELPEFDDSEALANFRRLRAALADEVSVPEGLVEEGSSNDPRVPHPDWLDEL